MLINQNLLQELYDDAGFERTKKAKQYAKENKIDILKMNYDDPNNFDISSDVKGNYDEYRVNVCVKNGELEVASCECRDYERTYGVCKHILATIIRLNQTRFWENHNEIKQDKKISDALKLQDFEKVISEFYNEQLREINSENLEELPNNLKIKLEPKIIFDRIDSDLKLEFKIGNNRMYKIKDLSEFYTRVINNEFYKYGQKLEFVHNVNNFEEKSIPLLKFILKYSEILKNVVKRERYSYYYSSNVSQPYLTLGNNTIDEAFDLLKNQDVIYEYDYISSKMNFIEDDPPIQFSMKKMKDGTFKFAPNIDIYEIRIFKGEEYDYLLDRDKLYRCSEKFKNSTIKLINIFKNNYIKETTCNENKLKDFFSIIMPQVKNNIKLLGISDKEIEEYTPKKLATKIFLDFDKNDYLILEPIFCYGEEEFNPFNDKIKIKEKRNEIQENITLNIFRKTGFMIDKENLRLILPDDDKIYRFLNEEIEFYMQKFEVMVTDNFKLKEIKKPKIGNIGVKVENNLLSIDLNKMNLDTKEFEEIMNKYKLKKNYHRLKDGSFLKLDDSEDLDFIDKLSTGLDVSYKDLSDGEARLPISRTLYLNELLKKTKDLSVTKNTEYKKIVNDLEKNNIEDDANVPYEMKDILRDYQKIGFKWLKVLESYHFGGILADDMGLGKTLQLLTIILSYIESEKESRKASIVVCPSSLSLNWKKEAERFADKLNVAVIHGKLQERKEIISQIENYDLIITSYDLLKRDIEFYNEKNYNFKYIIADEAQYLKNSNTQNAKAIKKLKADTRFALTGTPIENSLAELWSIFDFIMSGYLFSYRKFKSLYETPIVKDNDQKAMEKLKMLIEPFILRRTKKQVLVELPEKTISVLNNSMEDEQEKIYTSYLVKAKKEISDELKINGFENSHIKILAALTRLRQICCHPSLFIDNYEGGSSKLKQCIEIVQDGIEAGHKILLFSGYTAMFDIIEKELNKLNIKYFKLIGSTKVDERIKLVDEFNSNKEIKVFLISLKAGGTGLNLTGADMVIHYDPWWNASAENQATDRAYRIGQKNNVQVYKLITNNSIEEKIYELQKKKTELIDNMLDTKTSFVNKLSKDEIMSLFE